MDRAWKTKEKLGKEEGDGEMTYLGKLADPDLRDLPDEALDNIDPPGKSLMASTIKKRLLPTLPHQNTLLKRFRSSGVAETPVQLLATMVSPSVFPSNDRKLTLDLCDMNAVDGIRADTSSAEHRSS